MLHPSDSSERASVDGYQLSFVVLSCNLQGLIQVRSPRYLPSEYPCHVPKVAQVEGVELVDGQAFFSCAAGKKEVPIFWGERLLLFFFNFCGSTRGRVCLSPNVFNVNVWPCRVAWHPQPVRSPEERLLFEDQPVGALREDSLVESDF